MVIHLKRIPADPGNNQPAGWRVEPSELMLARGQNVTWTFEPHEKEVEALKAYFQFPPGLFDKNGSHDPSDGKDLKVSQHRSAKVQEAQQLTLKIGADAAKITYEYAVFVEDPVQKHHGFAIGHNPPPEITVGP